MNSNQAQNECETEVGSEVKLEDLELVTGGMLPNHTTYCKDPVAGMYECDSID